MDQTKIKWVSIILNCLLVFAILEVSGRILFSFVQIYDIQMWKYGSQLKRQAKDPAMVHEHIPGSSADLYGANIKINSKGLRDREISYQKPEGTKRILFLGDSLTLGWGVPFEFLFTKLMEKKITPSGGNRLEVINTGVGNYNTQQEFTYLKNEGYKYDADLIMLLYFINDAEPTPVYSDKLFIDKSILTVLLWSLYNKLSVVFQERKNYIHFYSDLYRADSPSWKVSRESLASMKELASRKGIEFIVAVCPELRIFKASYPFNEAHNKIISYLRDSNIPHIDLLPVFQQLADKEEDVWVSREDSHPNILGNEIIAEGIAQYFKNNPDKL